MKNLFGFAVLIVCASYLVPKNTTVCNYDTGKEFYWKINGDCPIISRAAKREYYEKVEKMIELVEETGDELGF